MYLPHWKIAVIRRGRCRLLSTSIARLKPSMSLNWWVAYTDLNAMDLIIEFCFLNHSWETFNAYNLEIRREGIPLSESSQRCNRSNALVVDQTWYLTEVSHCIIHMTRWLSNPSFKSAASKYSHFTQSNALLTYSFRATQPFLPFDLHFI